MWSRCLALCSILAAASAHAGSYYRCEDDQGQSRYQSIACGADSRVTERRVYEDVEATPVVVHASAPKSRPPAKAPRARSTRPHAPVAAYSCWLGAEQWVQSRPCKPIAVDGRHPIKPREQKLTQEQVCRQVRDGSYRGAIDERPADSAYRRNLMRDRGC